jgi:signal transduction histidine kinase
MRSLSSRLTIWYSLAATGTAALILVLGHYVIKENFLSGMDLLNDAEFEEIRPRITALEAIGSDQAAIHAIKEHTEIDASLFFFQVGHSDNDSFFTSSNMGRHEFPKVVHQKRRITIHDKELGPLRVGEYKAGGYDIHIASSLQGKESVEANLMKINILILVSVFLISLAIGYCLSRIALKPLTSIQATASKITAHNLSERITVPNTGDELASLATFLNSMFDRLQRSFAEVQRFTADASHELKTPLSLIRLNTEELLKQGETSPEEKSKILSNQLDQIDRLNRIISDLLILSKVDAGALKLTLSTQSTRSFISDFAEDAAALCEDANLELIVENDCDTFTNFDATWLRHLMFNLLSNAIRHSPAGSTLRIDSKKSETNWRIVFEDEGNGIPPEKIDRIFERFYKAHTGEGSGLGLALCHSVAQRHNGSITIKNREDRSGLHVEVSLPLESDD